MDRWTERVPVGNAGSHSLAEVDVALISSCGLLQRAGALRGVAHVRDLSFVEVAEG